MSLAAFWRGPIPHMAEKANGKISAATRAIRAGAKADLAGNTVNPPIQRGSTVLMPDGPSLYAAGQITYGRTGLQPHGALREALAEMEGAAGCCLYPNGLSAVTGVLLALLSAGDTLLVGDNVYNPSRRFCDAVLDRYGVSVRYFDPRSPVEEILATAGAKVLLFESPGSLTFDILDTPSLAHAARRRGITTVIDNTWGAGMLFKPLDHGVDIALQALTKYVGGHSDVFMGSAVTRDERLLRQLQEGVRHMGWGASPDDAYLMLRGLRTLPTRLARHQESALAVAAWLREQPEVAEVICPGLLGSRGHDLWKRDFQGQNGLLSIVLKPRPAAAVHAFLDAPFLIGLGYSWGGFESLAIHCDPQLTSRTLDWTYQGPLVRLQIGLEDPRDLIADLRRALDAYAAH